MFNKCKLGDIMSIYDFEVKDTQGNMVSLSEYKGKVLLIVNSATKCGFTPQYTELNEITGEEIAATCRSEYLVPYPIFEKIEVNGENEEPLYAYLKQEQPFKDITGDGARKLKMVLKVMDRHYKDNDDIKWNFTKFLVDREGNVVQRFEPTESLDDVKARVKELL